MPLAVTTTHFRVFHSNLETRNWFHSLPSLRFHALLTLFPKSFSPFPHGTCLLSVSSRYLALEENYLPFSAPLPKYATQRKPSVRAELQQDGTLTLSDAVFQRDLCQSPHWMSFSRLQFGSKLQIYNVSSSLFIRHY